MQQQTWLAICFALALPPASASAPLAFTRHAAVLQGRRLLYRNAVAKKRKLATGPQLGAVFDTVPTHMLLGSADGRQFQPPKLRR